MRGCPFCDIVSGRAPAEVIWGAWDDALAFRPLNPVVPGHTLVVPRVHVPDALHDPEVLASIAPAIGAAARILRDRLHADGFNLLSNVGEVAGQSTSCDSSRHSVGSAATNLRAGPVAMRHAPSPHVIRLPDRRSPDPAPRRSRRLRLD